MSTLSEELAAARKAKHMTQEQLAKAMNASRSAVSHWESGRNEPDLETLHRLSEVLECTFSVIQPHRPEPVPPLQNEAAPESDTPEISQAAFADSQESTDTAAVPLAPAVQTAKSSVKHKLLIPMISICALVMVICAVTLLRPVTKAAEPENMPTSTPFLKPIVTPDPGTPEWYAAAVKPQNGMPFVTILFNADPLYAINNQELFGDRPGWYYTTYLTETNGQPFTIRNVRLVNFMNAKSDVFDYPGEEVANWFGSSTLPARGQYSFNGGFPMAP